MSDKYQDLLTLLGRKDETIVPPKSGPVNPKVSALPPVKNPIAPPVKQETAPKKQGKFEQLETLLGRKLTSENKPILNAPTSSSGEKVSELERIKKQTAAFLMNPLGMSDESWDSLRQKQQLAIENRLGRGSVLSGVTIGAAEFAEEMLSPFQLALLYGTFGESALVRVAAKAYPAAIPAARTLAKLIQVKFLSDMTIGAAQGLSGSVKSAVDGDWESAGKMAVMGLASGLMATAGISHEVATGRIQGDLNRVAREKYGTGFDNLDVHRQGEIIHETVQRSPEYKNVLREVEGQDDQAHEQTQKQHKKRLANYYAAAISQSRNPSAAKRSVAMFEGITQRRKAAVDEESDRRQAHWEERTDERIERIKQKEKRGKLATELQERREELYAKRGGLQEQRPEDYARQVDVVSDGKDVEYPVKDDSFGVSTVEKDRLKKTSGLGIYRKTSEGKTEWLNESGNFEEKPENVYTTGDPDTADTLARLSSARLTADYRAFESDKSPEAMADVKKLEAIRRGLVYGEITAKDAQRMAGIAEKVTLPDEFEAARKGKLTGPLYETNLAKHLEDLEAELRKPSDDGTVMPEEDVKTVLDNAALLIRNETEKNLHHVYRSGDYIISKRGVRWILDATGMLRPDNGGRPIPLMKDGFYSNQAMQLAQSGRVGYGRTSYEDAAALRNKNRVTLEGARPKDLARERLEELAKEKGFASGEEYLRSNRLEQAAYELGYGNAADMEQAAYDMGFGNAEDLIRFKQSQRVPEGEPPYVTHQKELVEEVKDRAEGKVQDPEPKTPEAQQQADAADKRSRAASSEAVRAVDEAANPAGKSEEEAQKAAEDAEKAVKLAKEAAALKAIAAGKAVPKAQEPFPQKAPITIGLRGNDCIVEQNNRQFKAHFELVPIESLILSHVWAGDNLEKNPAFFEALQPRQPKAGQVLQRRIDAQEFSVDSETGTTSGYNFSRFANPTSDALSGPPLIEQGGMVVSGNGRVQRLIKHLRVLDEISDPNRRNGSQNELKGKMQKLAADSGISRYPNDGQFYAVVRILDEPIDTVGKASELGLFFNTAESENISDGARGLLYGRTLDDDTMKKIGRMVEDSEGGLEAAMRLDPYYFSQLVGEKFGIPASQRSEWFRQDALGHEVLTDDGEKLFRRAVVGYAINDPNIIATLEEHSATAYRAFEKSLGYITRLKAFPELDITGKIREALHASAETLNADVSKSRKGEKWAAVYRPDQLDLGGMEQAVPREPDRITETLWRALHASAVASPRTFSDRMKRFIGDEEVQEGMFGGGTPETPAERFNRVFAKELREVQFSRGDGVTGVTQEEFDAALKGIELEPKAEVKEPEVPAATVEAKPPAGKSQTDANQAEDRPTKYKHGNTQATIPEGSEAHTAIEAARQSIPDSDLAGDGKDIGGNHVTVRYGIQSDDVEGIKKYLAAQSPFEATLGKTSSFPPSSHSDGAAPIIAVVDAAELHRIEGELDKHGDFVERSFPEYKPHTTIAYVKPEVAEKYTGMDVTEGKKFLIDTIAITDLNGNEILVKLEGRQDERRKNEALRTSIDTLQMTVDDYRKKLSDRSTPKEQKDLIRQLLPQAEQMLKEAQEKARSPKSGRMEPPPAKIQAPMTGVIMTPEQELRREQLIKAELERSLSIAKAKENPKDRDFLESAGIHIPENLIVDSIWGQGKDGSFSVRIRDEHDTAHALILNPGDDVAKMVQDRQQAERLRNKQMLERKANGKSPKFGLDAKPQKLEAPPKADSAKEAETSAVEAKTTNGGVLSGQDFEKLIRNHPVTKKYASEIIRGAHLIARSFVEHLHPEDIEGEKPLDWLLRQVEMSGMETGKDPDVRGEYDFATGIMKLNEAADITTFWHEWFHAISPMLTAEDWSAIDSIEIDRKEWQRVWKKKWQWPSWKKEYGPDGKLLMPKGDALKGLQERLSYGSEKMLRDENPKIFKIGFEAGKVLEKIKKAFIAVYKAFDKDPLSALKLNDDARQWIGDRFGIEGYDAADKFAKELREAKAAEKKMPELNPVLKLAKEMGAKGIADSIEGKVEDSIGERVDSRKPTVVFKYATDDDAAGVWARLSEPGSKIQDAELIQTPEGEWGIRFNTKSKLPPDILFQGLPERHPGLQLEDLEKQLKELPSYKMAQRQLLQLKIDNLRNRIRAEHNVEPLDQKSEPELVGKVLEEVKRGKTADEVRTGTHGVSGLQEPRRVGRISKPSLMGMPHDAGTGQRGGAQRGAVARVPASLELVKPVDLQPMSKPRGTAVGMTVGQPFEAKAWVDGLKRSGLPENAPAPTWALDPKTAAVLKFPGQKQTVQLALSALEQGDGFVVASPAGTGKTYIGSAIIKEFLKRDPDALILHITKNAGLREKTKNVAANFFGVSIGMDTPKEDVTSGVYGVSYVGLINNEVYGKIKWDLVVADESGEARNWFKEDNQQGKMLITVTDKAKKVVYMSATPFHAPQEYGYVSNKLNLHLKGGFDNWIAQNFAHEKIGDRIVARLDPSKQAKLRQQLIERGQMVSQAISYDGYTAHFGVVPVTDDMKIGLDHIREGFARARHQLVQMGKKGMAEKAAAFEAVYTKNFLERERIPQAVELAKQARDKGWKVIIFSENSADDLFGREREAGADPSPYQELDDAMGGMLSKMIPRYEDVYDRLRMEFGDRIGDYSGRGNTMAGRRNAKADFMAGKTDMLYSTYAAGGIGIDLHDADFPDELDKDGKQGIKGGDKPRVAIFLGPPYSGVLLEQAMGRTWRNGVLSDSHAVFLATDSEPDIRLMQTKIGPRMRALRAAVLGEKDSLASAMATYTDEEKVRARQDALAYAEGDEVKVNPAGYQVRSKTRQVGINDWSQINFPHADTAKNKGMKYGEEVAGGDWTTLYQDKFGMNAPDSPEDSAGKKVVNEVANAAVSGKVESVQNLDPADRQAVVGLSAANATAEVELPVERDKEATARQSMKANLRNSSFIPYQGYTMSQYMGMQNIANFDGKPEVGLNLTRMGRSYQADWDTNRSQYWNMLDGILRDNGLYPKINLSDPSTWIQNRDAKLDKVSEEIFDVVEGKKVSGNQAINRAAADVSDMMRIVHQDSTKAGVRVTTKTGEKIAYGSPEFPEDPKHMPHFIDWDHELDDPNNPGQKVTLREMMKPQFDEKVRKRILESIPELRRYSTQQVLDYLERNDPRIPLQSHMQRAREINFPFYKKNYRVLLAYFDEAARSISAAKNYGWDDSKLTSEIKKIRSVQGRSDIQSMFRSALQPQDWSGWMAKVYNVGVAYEAASKMTFSAFKLPGHLVLPPLAMDGRVMPLLKGALRTALHPREVMENATYVGTLSRQLSAADMLYGEHTTPLVRGILKKEMFENIYSLVRVITGESANIYMEQYAMHDLKKGGETEAHTRRILRDRFLIGDNAIDQAIASGRFSPDDLAKGQTAFANLTTFSSDPLQMPTHARMEITHTTTTSQKNLNRAMRLTYILKSYGIKATSLLRETLYDEMVVHHNFRMIPYLMIASPIVGETVMLMSAGSKHVLHRAIEGAMGKQHTKDRWDEKLEELRQLGVHPDAIKATKELISSVCQSYGMEMTSMLGKPLFDLATGQVEKSDHYWWTDLMETLTGSFFSDIGKTGVEVTHLQEIQSGKKNSPAKKMEKYKHSITKYGVGQMPALSNVPQVEEELNGKPKGIMYYPR